MNLWTGMLKLALTEPWRRPVERLDEEAEVAFRVWPLDLDQNVHMNNAKYLVAMELARYALLKRTGLLRPVLKKRWALINAAQKVVFFRSLKLFQRYTVSARLLYLDDDNWFYLKQHVRSRGELVATGLFRMRIKEGRKTISPGELARLSGLEMAPEAAAPAPPPPELSAWNRTSEILLAERKREREPTP